MNSLTLFMLEIALCLGISLVLILLLSRLLRDVLTDMCGTTNRARFWVVFTQLMLVISPLLLVIFFASGHRSVLIELQSALFRILLGDFIALCAIGRVIWKSVSFSSVEPMPVKEMEVK